MAARLGFPRRPVVLLSGDGAATFNLTDLECAARQDLPFVMIVADDEAWGITLSGDLRAYGEPRSSGLGPFDFAPPRPRPAAPWGPASRTWTICARSCARASGRRGRWSCTYPSAEACPMTRTTHPDLESYRLDLFVDEDEGPAQRHARGHERPGSPGSR